jgi:hypothetical protein
VVLLFKSLNSSICTHRFHCSTLLANAAGDEAGLGEWGTWKPWFFVCMVIPLAVFQLKVVNIGAEKFKATKYFPSYNTCECFSSIFGSVVFHDLFWFTKRALSLLLITGRSYDSRGDIRCFFL